MQPTITLSYQDETSSGLFTRGALVPEGVWIRLRNAARELDRGAIITSCRAQLAWPSALSLLRVLSSLQGELGFEFDTDASSAERVLNFINDYKAVRSVSGSITSRISQEQIQDKLLALGWNVPRHDLKTYQLQDLQQLISLSNGANFSVPGAGKTTVTFALHLLLRGFVDKVLVVAPRNAFLAWETVVNECISDHASNETKAPFVVLSGGEAKINSVLSSGCTRYIISYDQLVRVADLVENYLAVHRVHLILDESHKMKSGSHSQRGTVLLKMGHLAVRRDILSGTPMPQGSADIQSQLDFLWPGTGLGSRIAAGAPPRSVLGNLYVRTTKQQLGLPQRNRVFVPVSLTDAHLAFYSVLRDDVRAQASALRRGNSAIALINARKSVVRLLQAAVNPELVAETFLQSTAPDRAALLRAVLSEGPSARVRAAAKLAENLVADGKKVLIWTIFTSTINQLRQMLTYLQPALLFGQIGIGDEDDDSTRQGQIRRFKTDSQCRVMIANPAAAAEGISLHMHCHDAIYVDRSYNSVHFLQSIDRIHRLGLPPDVVTTIYLLQNKLPSGVGSIDMSVSRRLATKIRNMERLLEDPDLHELALDEENAPLAIEDTIDAEDIDDLVAELEGKMTPQADDDALG